MISHTTATVNDSGLRCPSLPGLRVPGVPVFEYGYPFGNSGKRAVAALPFLNDPTAEPAASGCAPHKSDLAFLQSQQSALPSSLMFLQPAMPYIS